MSIEGHAGSPLQISTREQLATVKRCTTKTNCFWTFAIFTMHFISMTSPYTGPLTFLLHGIFIIRSLLILLAIGSLRNIFQVLHGVSVYENNSNYEIPVRYGDWLTMFNSTNHTEARLFFGGNVLTDNAILLKRYICWAEWRIILNTSVKNRKLGTVENWHSATDWRFYLTVIEGDYWGLAGRWWMVSS